MWLVRVGDDPWSVGSIEDDDAIEYEINVGGSLVKQSRVTTWGPYLGPGREWPGMLDGWWWVKLRHHTRHPGRWQPALVEGSMVTPMWAIGPGVTASTDDVTEWGPRLTEPGG